ncbi:MAG: OmpA family protein [Candidatus Omnitrophica bacterium]|nr:OmpA family protein [Candidatus Omnitrophota bacterium]
MTRFLVARAWSRGVLVATVVAALSGCGINFYAGRPTDVRRIQELSTELDRLRQQKERESQQLREAKALLEQRLQQEIADQQVKLEMAERGLVITFVAEVLFDSGKAALRSEAHQALDTVAQVIQQKVSDRDIGVEGHTDNEPIKHSGWKSNWELSTARATSVIHFFESQGLNPRQLSAIGYGEYRPVASNDAMEGRQKNRRVEIVILPKKLTKREADLLRRAPEIDASRAEASQYK